MDRDPERLMEQFLEMKAALQRDMQGLVSQGKLSDRQHGDFGDLASVETDLGQRQILIQRKKTEIGRINAAIRKLQQDPDNFGFCEDCGEPIPIERLMERPHTLHCVSCKQAIEAREERMMHQPAYSW